MLCGPPLSLQRLSQDEAGHLVEQRLAELFAQGLGPRAAHRVVAEKASYGTVHAIHR
jgi:hypothetical protein